MTGLHVHRTGRIWHSIGWSVVSLVLGFRAIYVHQGGVVCVHNGNARAATWAEVSALTFR